MMDMRQYSCLSKSVSESDAVLLNGVEESVDTSLKRRTAKLYNQYEQFCDNDDFECLCLGINSIWTCHADMVMNRTHSSRYSQTPVCAAPVSCKTSLYASKYLEFSKRYKAGTTVWIISQLVHNLTVCIKIFGFPCSAQGGVRLYISGKP
ncbi:hypothetical protein BJV82DRAFT_340454 [Fennellomyces sp. T-0311]|nr:hypothetical protein BJV82DRAFT_340454 [Fennellomyces sp. T-0311]